MDYQAPKFYCGGCGSIFDMDDVDQDAWDDLRCPDCGSGDVGGIDDLDEDDEDSEQDA